MRKSFFAAIRLICNHTIGLFVCVFICMCTVCVHVRACIFLHECACAFCTYVCLCMCISTRIYACICMYVCVWVGNFSFNIYSITFYYSLISTDISAGKLQKKKKKNLDKLYYQIIPITMINDCILKIDRYNWLIKNEMKWNEWKFGNS